MWFASLSQSILIRYEAKIEADPLNTDLILELANFLIEKRLFDRAIPILLKLNTIDNENITALTLLMDCYEKVERYEDAIKIGNIVLRLNDKDLETIFKMGEFSQKLDRLNDAISYFDRLVRKNASNKKAWIKKAEIYEKIGEDAESLKAWQNVYKIDPKNIEALYYTGIDSFNKKSFESSAKNFKSLITLCENEDTIYLNSLVLLALSLQEIGGFDNAINKILHTFNYDEAMDKITVDDDFKVRFLLLLAERSNKDKSYDEAIHILNDILQIQNSEEANYKLSKIYYNMAKDLYSKKKYSDAEYKVRLGMKSSADNEECKALLNKILAIKKTKSKRIKIAVFALLLIGVFTSAVWYAAHGSINIKINVPAQEITLIKNGEVISKAANTKELFKDSLLIGKYSVQIIANGYEDLTKNIKLGLLSKLDESIDLQPKLGSIEIDSIPSGMEIYVGGKLKGKTPVRVDDLLAILNTIELKNKKYYWKKDVLIEEDKTKDFGKVNCESELFRKVESKMSEIRNLNKKTHAFIELSKIHILRKNNRDANRTLKNAISSNKRVLDINKLGWNSCNIAKCYIDIDEISTAKKIGSKIVNKNARNHTYANIAIKYAKKGNYEKSLKILKLQTKDSKPYWVYSQIALEQKKKGKIKLSKQTLRRIKKRKDIKRCKYNLEFQFAISEIEKGNLQNAQKSINSLKNNNQKAGCYNEISKIFFKNNDMGNARRYLYMAEEHAKKI